MPCKQFIKDLVLLLYDLMEQSYNDNSYKTLFL